MPLLSQVTVLIFAALLCVAALEDIRRLMIPNRLSIAVALLYPAYVIATPFPIEWQWAIVWSAVTLVFGFFLFAVRWVGGGDVKLFAAASLWAGPALFPEYLLVTTCFGALIALFMMAHRHLAAYGLTSLPVTEPATPTGTGSGQLPEEEGGVRRALPANRCLPYAVAVAAGGLYVSVILINGR